MSFSCITIFKRSAVGLSLQKEGEAVSGRFPLFTSALKKESFPDTAAAEGTGGLFLIRPYLDILTALRAGNRPRNRGSFF